MSDQAFIRPVPVAEAAAERRRQRRITIAAFAVGLVFLLPAWLTAALAGLMVCGLYECRNPDITGDPIWLPLGATALLLSTGPAVMTLGRNSRRWWLITAVVFVTVIAIGALVVWRTVA